MYKKVLCGNGSEDLIMMRKGKIENQGYLDNYVMYDCDLRPIADLEKYVLYRFKKEK